MKTIRVRLDKKRNLLYTPDSFTAARQILGKTNEGIGAELQRLAGAIDPHILGAVLWAGLIHEDRGLHVGCVRALVYEMGFRQRLRIKRKILRALRLTLAEVTEKYREVEKVHKQIAEINQRIEAIRARFPSLARPKYKVVGGKRGVRK